MRSSSNSTGGMEVGMKLEIEIAEVEVETDDGGD